MKDRREEAVRYKKVDDRRGSARHSLVGLMQRTGAVYPEKMRVRLLVSTKQKASISRTEKTGSFAFVWVSIVSAAPTSCRQTSSSGM